MYPKLPPAELPTALSHLSEKASEFWKKIVTAYELEAHHEELLLVACESLDRREVARALLSKDGLTVVDNRGICRPHPAAIVAQSAAAMLIRSVRELNLDLPADEVRAPGVRQYSSRRRA